MCIRRRASAPQRLDIAQDRSVVVGKSLRLAVGGGGDVSDTLDEIRAAARIDDRAFRLERTDALVEGAKARKEALRGALADIGYSADMKMKVARAKARRVYGANPPAEEWTP